MLIVPLSIENNVPKAEIRKFLFSHVLYKTQRSSALADSGILIQKGENIAFLVNLLSDDVFLNLGSKVSFNYAGVEDADAEDEDNEHLTLITMMIRQFLDSTRTSGYLRKVWICQIHKEKQSIRTRGKDECSKTYSIHSEPEEIMHSAFYCQLPLKPHSPKPNSFVL
ncbi:hypothetical protein Tco_1181968 [Tanacetum coccineum]